MSRTKKIETIDFKYNFRIYWDIMRKYKYLFIALLFFTSITESSQLVDKLVFKVLIDRGTEFAANTLLKESFINILIFISGIFALTMVVRAFAKWMFLHIINKIESSAIKDLKVKFFNHIIHLSHGFHTTHKTGSLISRLVRGGNNVERMTDVIAFNFAPLIIQIIVVCAALIYFSMIPAIVVLITVISFVGYSAFINHIQQGSRIAANEAEDAEKANISDIFTNIDSIKYFGKEDLIKKRFFQISEITKISMRKNWDYFRWLDPGQSIILSVGTFFLMYFPVKQFINNEMTLGTLVFIYAVYGNLMGPLFGFVYGIRNFYRAIADFDDLFQYAKVENDILDKPGAADLKIKKGTIEFKDVSFSFQKRKIFTKLNLKIPENKKVALVGSSGSGKTTLVKLLYRLYDLEGGAIKIDGTNICDVRQESLRSELSIVPQECILFDDTVYNNIAFSKPNATKEEVFAAIKFAQLDRIIEKFPNKENTIVGERGVRLSGGEKQRVSIARAILADKKVLLLDEATSALDSETEHEIQKDLERLMKGRTSIIIAHRLSTIMKADLIVVVDDGKIMDVGTHKQLLNNKSKIYTRLWKLQNKGYLEEKG